MRKLTLALIMLLLLTLTAEAQTLSDIQMSLLNQDPTPAQAGDVVEVRLRVINNGEAEVRDFTVSFIPEYPFSVLPGEDSSYTITSLPNWPEEDSSRTLVFKLRIDRDAVLGQYAITFKSSTGDVAAAAVVDEFIIEVTANEYAEIIYIDKSKLIPGKETPMTFTINNLGSAPLQNMLFSWDEENGYILPVNTDNTRYIRYLGPKESIELQYTVVASVNANPDLYQIDLELEYDVNDGSGVTTTEIVSTQAGVFIGGETDFDVTFSESSAGQTSLSVSNVGSSPAYSVTVRIPQQAGFSIVGSTDAIIGNLDKGDYTMVSFQIAPSSEGMAAKGDAEGMSRDRFASDSNLDVVIEYTDTTGVRQSLEKIVSIQFRAPGTIDMGSHTEQLGMSKQKSLWRNPWVIGIILIIGFVIYRKREAIRARISKK